MRPSTVDDTSTSAEDAVLAHLAGASLDQAARDHHVSACTLRDLVERYTSAGRAALQEGPSPWRQFIIDFHDPSRAETAAVRHLLPALLRAHDDSGMLWWFVRKSPGWRVRVQTTTSGSVDSVDIVAAALQAARVGGSVRDWWCTPYEPETTAFGGLVGIDLAHGIFVADSDGIARLIARHHVDDRPPDRRLLSLLLMTHLQHAAGLDRYERADVWAKVAAQRPAPALPATVRPGLTAKAGVVLTSDTHALTQPGGPLAPYVTWADGLASLGARLGRASRAGALTRGLRAVLAQHVLFHWNRLGIPAEQQSVWAATATDALLGDTDEP